MYIDQEARFLVHGDRPSTYGHPRVDFERIAQIWNALLRSELKCGGEITSEHVALMMAGLKLSRLANNATHRDSKVDVIGYILALDRLHENRMDYPDGD